jgi:ABC-type glycerol-3-phosphate transport system substrate-binding protein
MTTRYRVTRRQALRVGAAAAALPLVHIRTAGAAGKVSIGFWDHWVPGGNDVMQKQVETWAQKNQVEPHVDFITSTGGKLQITGAAEAQARRGTTHWRSSTGTYSISLTRWSRWTT